MQALFKTSQYEAGYFFNNLGVEEYYMIDEGQLRSFDTIDELVSAINGKIKAHLAGWHAQTIQALDMLENARREKVGIAKFQMTKQILETKKTLELQEEFLFKVGAFKSNAGNLIHRISTTSKVSK